jgi:hypothetical protein
LLSEWDASKEIVRSAPYEGMDTKCKEIMLAEIAYKNFVGDRLFFQQGEITQEIEQILREMLAEEKFIDGRAVLRAIEEQHGVLVSRADDIYSFSHLTLQEFLSAKHIVDNNIDIKNLVTNHLCDRRWREVFLILAGLRRADELLLTMEQTINSLINTPKLQDLFTWVERVTDSSAGDFQPVGKRAIALIYANVFNLSFNFDFSLAFEFANTKAKNLDNTYKFSLALFNTKLLVYPKFFFNTKAVELANVLDEFIYYVQWSEKWKIYQEINYSKLIATLEELKQEIPDNNESKEVRQAFGQRIIHIWLTAFQLTPEMIDLSASELTALDNYFYANLLMVECKKAAVRVSPKTWEGIESRMLLPARNQH